MTQYLVFTITCYVLSTISQSGGVSNFIYYNQGTTNSNQSYELVGVKAIYNEGYQYKNDPLSRDQYSVGSPMQYLFEKLPNGTIISPSSGLRSSVPLGPIGQGTFEIRGDGRMTDITIFNNGPNAETNPLAIKLDLNDAVFGFKFMDQTQPKTVAKIFQTSPLDENMQKYAIQSLTYSGSYPTSRLMGIDNDLQSIGINYINLTAFSPFQPLNTNKSSIPGVVFWFDIETNNNFKSDTTMDIFYNFPDVINIDDLIITNNKNGFTLNKNYNVSDDAYFTSGNISFTLQSCDNTNQCNSPLINTTNINSSSLYQNWMQFLNQDYKAKENIINDPTNFTMYNNYALISRDIKLSSNSLYEFSLVLSWFYPMRTFGHNNTQYLGHYYNNIYSSSDQVNQDIIKNLPDIISSILSWHQLWDTTNPNLYPNYLRDILLNVPGYIARTGYYLEKDINGTGIWRQVESFSCFQVDPPHIHGYRSFAYQLLFGHVLDRGTLNMFSFGLIDGGLVSEKFGGSCGGDDGIMGIPSGGPRGDDNSIYIMDMYSQFKWYKDGVKFVGDRYQYVKQAMDWIINQSIPNGFGLPYRLVNTNDEHGVIGDVNTYNSFLYISALHAMQIMTQYFEPNNSTYNEILNNALDYAYGNLSLLLWQPYTSQGVDNSFYREMWCQNGNYSQYALQSDVLYGYLWGLILDLDNYWQIPINNITLHLKQEYKRNWSKYGLVFMTNRTGSLHCTSSSLNKKKDDNLGASFQDFDTWEMATIDHFVERVFLNDYLNSDLSDTFSILETGLNKYRNLYRDQWDWRDASSTYTDSDPEYSRPVVNSHYCRQLIEYTSILALNGQDLNIDHKTGKLIFKIAPKISLDGNNGCLPILMPQAHISLCLDVNKKCFELNGIFGNVEIDEFLITNANTNYTFVNTSVVMGQMTKLCY